jgi:hypothetical protein
MEVHDQRDGGSSARVKDSDTVGAILRQNDVSLGATEGCFVGVIHFPELAAAPQHPNQSPQCYARSFAVENRLAIERRNPEVSAHDADDAREAFIMCADERRDHGE